MLQTSGGTYTDEATQTTMTLGGADIMSAVLPTVTAGASLSGVWITPLTSMAQARAAGLAGGMTSANITAATIQPTNNHIKSPLLNRLRHHHAQALHHALDHNAQ